MLHTTPAELAKTPARHAKFACCAEIVSEPYPDLSDHDPDSNKDHNIRAEGLDAAVSHGELKRLALEKYLADPDLMLIMTRVVVAAALQLCDPNGCLHYRGDRKVVDMEGREHSFRRRRALIMFGS